LKSKPNQIGRAREEVHVTAKELLDVRVPGGTITEAGLRNNVTVGVQYVAAWLQGTGVVAILNLMEDTATAEIARSQVWQWIHHAARLREGPLITRDLVAQIATEELATVRSAIGDDTYATGKFEEARHLFEAVALDNAFVEFLTIRAYDRVE